MKIAYIYDAVYPWVKGRCGEEDLRALAKAGQAGHEVHCYGMKWWPGDETILKDGVHLHGICRPMPLYSEGRRSMRQAVYFAAKVLSIAADCELVDCQNFPIFPASRPSFSRVLKDTGCSSPGMRFGAITGTSIWEERASSADS